MEKLKPCSACGSGADYIGDTGFVWCTKVHCFFHREYEFTADWWNTRPIEDALRAELARKDTEIKALERMLKVAHVLHVEKNHRKFQAARARLAEVRQVGLPTD